MYYLWHNLSTFYQLLLLIDLINLLESEQILSETFEDSAGSDITECKCGHFTFYLLSSEI